MAYLANLSSPKSPKKVESESQLSVDKTKVLSETVRKADAIRLAS
jgi:hypothetical protein